MPIGPFFLTYPDIALLLLRIALGVIFLVHGWTKIRNLAKTRQAFTSMMVPVPLISSIYAAFVEFFGGLFLFTGLYTGWVLLALVIDMFGAMLFVDFKKGFSGGWEFNLALVAMASALLLMGPGSFTVMQYLGK